MKRFALSWTSCIAAVVAIGAESASAQSLPPGVEECLEEIRQQRLADADEEAPRLGDVCPELAAAIDAGPWGRALSEVSADQLSASEFIELTALVAVYARTGTGGFELRPETLDESLAALKVEKPSAELTLWERIERWFEDQFGSQADARSWLDKWLEHLSVSERIVRYLVIVLGVVLVGATVFVVVNELRVAGLLARGVLGKYAPLEPSAREPADERPRDLDDLARAPLARRPVLLLKLVLERLRARGRPPLRDSFTHRELLRAASGLSAEQSAAFAAVVGAAERVTFSDWRPEEREVEGIVASGRALLESFPADEDATR